MERSQENVSYLQTVGRAMQVLMLFQNENYLPLSEIAARLEVNPPIAYRLVYTLATEGFLYQEPVTKQYGLGDKAIMLGFCTAHRHEAKRVTSDLLRDFYAKTRYSVVLTIPCVGQSLCIFSIFSPPAGKRTSMFIGGLYPLYNGASNRVLLAFMPKAQQERLIQSFGLPQEEENQLRAALKLAEERGYDFTTGAMTGGMYSIGFPIYNSSNQLSAGLSTGGLIEDVTEDDITQQIQEVRLLAKQANLRMGVTRYQYQ